MKIAIIVPRYGLALAGGAEKLGRGLAEHLAGRDHAVEVWTSCATNHYTWANELPAGTTTINQIPVRRFAIDPWDVSRRAELEGQLAVRGTLPLAEQYEWLACGPVSSALCAYTAGHAPQFDAILSMPYLNSLSYYPAWVAPQKTYLLPCLHDEVYAYLEPIRLLMENVAGVLFNAPEEAALASQRLRMKLAYQAVLGIGVEGGAEVPAGAIQPHLLYVGRLEEGKNVPLLYDFVQRYAKEGGKIGLTVIGSGPLEPPNHPAFTFRGFVPEAEKAAACATALALCQPSLNESFSFTVMESWLATRPVLVHLSSAVTWGHVRRSKGGLAFSNYEEFAQALTWLQNNPLLAKRMGANGRAYVEQNYRWPTIIDRLERILSR